MASSEGGGAAEVGERQRSTEKAVGEGSGFQVAEGIAGGRGFDRVGSTNRSKPSLDIQLVAKPAVAPIKVAQGHGRTTAPSVGIIFL